MTLRLWYYKKSNLIHDVVEGKQVEHSEVEEAHAARTAPEIFMADLVMPNQTNYYRTMFGGAAMAFMDKACAIAALQFCRLPIVTASSEHIDFCQPIYEGEMIEALARVIYAGRTSLVSRVHIYGEDAIKNNRRLCTTGYFSLVAIDPDGKKIRMPGLLLEDDQAREEWTIGERIHNAIAQRRKRT
jgi:acyl-CoA hydrolase